MTGGGGVIKMGSLRWVNGQPVGYWLVRYKDFPVEVVFVRTDGVILINEGQHTVTPDDDSYSKYEFIEPVEHWKDYISEDYL